MLCFFFSLVSHYHAKATLTQSPAFSFLSFLYISRPPSFSLLFFLPSATLLSPYLPNLPTCQPALCSLPSSRQLSLPAALTSFSRSPASPSLPRSSLHSRSPILRYSHTTTTCFLSSSLQNTFALPPSRALTQPHPARPPSLSSPSNSHLSSHNTTLTLPTQTANPSTLPFGHLYTPPSVPGVPKSAAQTHRLARPPFHLLPRP